MDEILSPVVVMVGIVVLAVLAVAAIVGAVVWRIRVSDSRRARLTGNPSV